VPDEPLYIVVGQRRLLSRLRFYLFRLLYSQGGTGLGIDQSPRLASSASASDCIHSLQIGLSQ